MHKGGWFWPNEYCWNWRKEAESITMPVSWLLPSAGPYKFAMRSSDATADSNFNGWYLLWTLWKTFWCMLGRLIARPVLSKNPKNCQERLLYHRPYQQNVLCVVATASFVEMFLRDDLSYWIKCSTEHLRSYITRVLVEQICTWYLDSA